MRCENCGVELASGSSFCTSCGAKVTSRTAQENIGIDQANIDYSQQYNYAPPQQQYYPQPVTDPPLSVGQYIGIFLLMMIPVVNLVLLLVWAFSGSINRNRKNYARATLIMMLISIVLLVILIATFGFAILNFFGDFNWVDNLSRLSIT